MGDDPATIETTFLIFAMGWADDDSEDDESTSTDYVTWYVNSGSGPDPVQDNFVSNGGHILSGWFVRGDTVAYSYTPCDQASECGSSVNNFATPWTITNDVPSMPGIDLYPTDSSGTPTTVAGEEDDLNCGIVTPSVDPDGDNVDYVYTWYKNLIELTGATTSQVSSVYTMLGDNFYCVVTPYDDYMGGNSGPSATSATITIQDVNAPPPPVIDAIVRYTNDDEVDISGTCEISNTVTLICVGDLLTDVYNEICTNSGTFWFANVALERGADVTCEAYSTDLSSNESPYSNDVRSMSCAVEDIFDTWGEGNSSTDLAPEDYLSSSGYWGGTLMDIPGATPLTYSGTVLVGDRDWLVIDVGDDLAGDIAAGGFDYFNLEMTITDETPDGHDLFTMVVYRGVDPSTTSPPDCTSQTTFGYTQYNYCHEGTNEGPDWNSGSGTAETKFCHDPAFPTDWQNDCEDYSAVYGIKILRDALVDPSCESYTLTITNGTWASYPSLPGTECQTP
jgi:hypothetical protein